MSKKKFYAVLKGRETGIFKSWDECKIHLEGFSGAKYEGFSTLEEAESYLESDHKSKINDEEVIPVIDYNAQVAEDLSNNRVVAFTDGSYSGKDKVLAYGCYIITPRGEIQEISDIVRSKRFDASNNITAEVIGVLESLKWVVANGFEKVTIYHDLENIGKWVRGEYKAKSDIAKLLMREITEKYNEIIDMNFVWVKGHSGVEFNEKADELAVNAIRTAKPIGRYGPNFFSGKGVSREMVYEIIDVIKRIDAVEYKQEVLVNGGVKHTFKRDKEKLTVVYYSSSGTTVLQGEVRSLFSEFLSRYTEHIDSFKMIRAYSDSFKSSIDVDTIESMISNLKLPSDYPGSAIILLKQSFVMLGLDRKEIDYSHYVSPAYRALEGHFKYLCEKIGIHIPERSLNSHFVKEDGLWVIQTTKLKGHEFSSKVEDVYNLIVSNRHPISHFGEILVGGLDTTLLIPDISEARSRIVEVLNLVKF